MVQLSRVLDLDIEKLLVATGYRRGIKRTNKKISIMTGWEYKEYVSKVRNATHVKLNDFLDSSNNIYVNGSKLSREDKEFVKGLAAFIAKGSKRKKYPTLEEFKKRM